MLAVSHVCIAIVTQLSIKNGEPLFTVGYRDPPYYVLVIIINIYLYISTELVHIDNIK